MAAARAVGGARTVFGGARIVYESNQTGDHRIWVMNADDPATLGSTNDPGFGWTQPSWSPHGKRTPFSWCDDHVGFILTCDLEAMNAALAAACGGWRAALDLRPRAVLPGRAGDRRRDRPGRFPERPVADAFGRDGAAPDRRGRRCRRSGRAGPDGRGIVFTDSCCQFGSNISTVRPDGTGLRELTHFGPALLKVASPATRPTAGGSSCNTTGNARRADSASTSTS